MRDTERIIGYRPVSEIYNEETKVLEVYEYPPPYDFFYQFDLYAYKNQHINSLVNALLKTFRPDDGYITVTLQDGDEQLWDFWQVDYANLDVVIKDVKRLFHRVFRYVCKGWLFLTPETQIEDVITSRIFRVTPEAEVDEDNRRIYTPDE